MSNESRERIGGFQVLRRLAMGQTSEILLARADGPFGFERPVVLKRLLPHFRDDPTFGRMFAREATAYARLTHPAIVKLYDFFAGDGQLVMVLEHIDGVSLERLVTHLAAPPSSPTGLAAPQHLDDRAALWIGWRVFTALAAAHAATDPVTEAPAPVVHRDVNPSNVLIPWDGHVKLGDFGVARVAGMGGDTQVGGLVHGQFGYAAPEQVRGDTVTPAADVYAAALLVWELMARRRAFPRGSLPDVELLKTMANPQLPPLDKLRPDLEPTLRRAIARCLTADVAQRTISAEEMAGIMRASGRLEEGREVLVQAAARIRRSDASGPKVPPLFDEESITNAVASLRTVLPAAGAVAAAPAPDATKVGSVPPATPRALVQMPPTSANPSGEYGAITRSTPSLATGQTLRQVSQPSFSERSPVITSLMGWAETVPFEAGPQDAIPETLRGDIPAPVPLTKSYTALDPMNETMPSNGSSPPRATSEAPKAAESSRKNLVAAVAGAEKSDGVTPPAEPTAPVVDVHQAPTTFPGAFASPFSLATSFAAPAPPPLPELSLPPEPGTEPGADSAAVTDASPAVQMDTTSPAVAVPPAPTSSSRKAAESASGIPSTRLPPPKPLDPVPPPYVPPIIGMQTSPSLPPRPLDRKPGRPMMRLAIGVLVAALVAVGAFVAWGHFVHAAAEPATPTTSAATTATTDDQSGGAPSATQAASATAAPTDTAAPPVTASVPVPAPPASASAKPPTAPSSAPLDSTEPAAGMASGTGQLSTSAQLAGHRVYVDGKVVGNSPGPMAAPCGKHRVKVGSSGAETVVDITCGQVTTIQ